MFTSEVIDEILEKVVSHGQQLEQIYQKLEEALAIRSESTCCCPKLRELDGKIQGSKSYPFSGLTVYVAIRYPESSLIGVFSTDDEAQTYIDENCTFPEEIKIEPHIVDDNL